MLKTIEKICLGIIFVAVSITLFIPLVTNSSFFFPFIFPKVLVFRVVIEAALLAYLLLAYLNSEYRPKFDLVFLAALIFVILAFISSIFGPDFYLSFWGDIERGEGLILWLHLLVYFVLIFNVLKTEKIWLYFLELSLFSGFLLSLFGLAQALNIESVLNTAGQRVSSTIGNPAFLATYLFFQITFASYLFVYRKNVFFKIYYAGLIILFSGIIFATQTRGAMIGLLAGFLITSALLIFKSKNKPVKIISLSLVILIFLSVVALYFFKDSQIVRNSRLQSTASIFTFYNEKTFKTRVMAWGAAWQGFEKRPVFGYGLENYAKVFDKNFPPEIYEDAGSQVWFDRAHNFIFDRMITTGVLGLLAYLIFVLLPAFYLFFWLFFRNEPDDDKQKSKKAFAIVFISLTIAFLVQNLAIFETITTYVILFFSWAFLAKILEKDIFSFSAPAGKGIWLSGFIFYLIVCGPLIWLVNIKPAKANLEIAKAMHLEKSLDDPNVNYSFFDVVDQFKKGLEIDTYGNPEYRIQFIDFIGTKLANLGEVVDAVKPIIAYTDEMVEKQINLQPNSSKNYLVAMRHYNYTFAALPEDKFNRLDKALSFFPKFAELSPTRPHVYQEAGYSNLYKYRNYKEIGEEDLAQQAFLEAEKHFQKTIELNPKVVESYVNLIMLYLNVKEGEKINLVIEQMEENKTNFRQDNHLEKLFSLAASNKNYYWAKYFTEEQLKKYPKNISFWKNLALCYAYLGEDEEAISTAEKITEIDPVYLDLVDLFIEEVKAGKYKIK